MWRDELITEGEDAYPRALVDTHRGFSQRSADADAPRGHDLARPQQRGAWGDITARRHNVIVKAYRASDADAFSVKLGVLALDHRIGTGGDRRAGHDTHRGPRR